MVHEAEDGDHAAILIAQDPFEERPLIWKGDWATTGAGRPPISIVVGISDELRALPKTVKSAPGERVGLKLAALTTPAAVKFSAAGAAVHGLTGRFPM